MVAFVLTYVHVRVSPILVCLDGVRPDDHPDQGDHAYRYPYGHLQSAADLSIT